MVVKNVSRISNRIESESEISSQSGTSIGITSSSELQVMFVGKCLLYITVANVKRRKNQQNLNARANCSINSAFIDDELQCEHLESHANGIVASGSERKLSRLSKQSVKDDVPVPNWNFAIEQSTKQKVIH